MDAPMCMCCDESCAAYAIHHSGDGCELQAICAECLEIEANKALVKAGSIVVYKLVPVYE